MDLLVTGANVITLDDRKPSARSLLIRRGRFEEVWAEGEMPPEIEHRPDLQVLDLGGRTVVPGFNDSHSHLISVGLRLDTVWLFGVRSIAEMQRLVAEKAAVTPPGEWIHGVGWVESLFAEGRLPNRHDLDAVAPNHPVVLDRVFNMVVCNSLALQMAGITRDTPNPPLGTIDKDPETGEPTGIVRDTAKSLLTRARGMRMSTWDLVAARDEQEMMEKFEQAILRAGEEYLRNGITSVVDPGLDPLRIRAYQNLYRQGRLPLRVTVMPEWYGFTRGHSADFDESVLPQRLEAWGVYTGFGDEFLRLGALKMSLDGGLGSMNAYLNEPYVGQAEPVRHLRVEPELLPERIAMGHRAGWSVGVHCCGDAAQDMVARAFAQVLDRYPQPEMTRMTGGMTGDTRRGDMRHHIIHAYFPTPATLRIMREYGILAVLQPAFLYLQGDKYPRIVGTERAARFTPIRTYLEAGVKVVCNSDAPSGFLNPFVGIYAAVTRKTLNGLELGPEQRVSRLEALRLFTAAGAYLTFEEDDKGTISPGKLADMVVLSANPLTVPEEGLKDITVDMTFVGGKLAYRRT